MVENCLTASPQELDFGEVNLGSKCIKDVFISSSSMEFFFASLDSRFYLVEGKMRYECPFSVPAGECDPECGPSQSGSASICV